MTKTIARERRIFCKRRCCIHHRPGPPRRRRHGHVSKPCH
jgi:hypothetical protein